MKKYAIESRCFAGLILLVALASLILAWTPGQPAHAVVLAHWKLDGDTSDATGNNPDGTLNSSGGYVAAHLDQGLDFISTGGHVDTGVVLDAGPKTMVFCAKTNSFATDGLWAGNEAGSAQRWYYGTRSSKPFVAGGTTYGPIGAWKSTDTSVFHHYALVDYGSANTQLIAYQDGQQVATLAYSGSTATYSGKDFEIGRSGGGGSSIPARAIIDDVALFDAALPAHEISLIAQYGVDGYFDVMDRIVYRETFPNDGTSDRVMPPAEGWYAHYENGYQSGSTKIVAGEGSQPVVPINASADHDSLTEGYGWRDPAAAGRDYLYWTQEYTIDSADQIKQLAWHQRNDLDTDLYQVALRLDTGTLGNSSDDTWYVSADTFTNLTAAGTYTNSASEQWYINEFSPQGAFWQVLDFRVNTALEILPGTTSLPSGIPVTAFGLYSLSVNDDERYDNFQIQLIPEPATLVLLGLGAIGLLLFRKRRSA